MKQYLFLTSALVVSGLLSGAAEAACIQTPSCSSLGYTSSQSCNGGVKCPFGNAWNCTAAGLTNKITELTNKITEQTNKITTIEEKIVTIENGVTTSNCTVGDILFSDMTLGAYYISDKTPIGVVFDCHKKLAIALDMEQKTWSDSCFDVPGLDNIDWREGYGDMDGKKNTQIVLEYCKAKGYRCPAFEYVNSYKTEGTKEGDWYLPSYGELDIISLYFDLLNAMLNRVSGASGLPSYKQFWSSTEHSGEDAFSGCVSSTCSSSGDESKRSRFYVRPVIAF